MATRGDAGQAAREGARATALTVVKLFAEGAIEIGASAPVVAPLCVALLEAKGVVDGASRNKEELQELHERCEMITVQVIEKAKASKTSTIDVSPLQKCVDELEVVAKRYDQQRKFTRVVLFRKNGDDIQRLRKRIEDVVPIMGLAVGVAIADQLEDVRQMVVQLRVADVASRVKVPSGAPRIRDWHVERKALVSQACDRLGIVGGKTDSSSSEEPRMVGLAGPGGAGKSTVASMVIAREDVRAAFHKGILWLQVGQGAKDRLPELRNRLAGMVYETVMLKSCRPHRKTGIDTDPEDGVAYIPEVVDENSRRFLVVADDVWEVEVLKDLKRAGVWVLYTTRDGSLLPEATLHLDQVLKEEAELVLRRAADLDDDADLPEAAYELMTQCEYGVMYLAFVGRWSDVRGRGRSEEKAWQAVLTHIVEAQQGSEGGQLLSWPAAVLRAGLAEMAHDNAKNKELYLSLAVIPKGFAFPSEVAAVLLYGQDLSAGDIESTEGIVTTLERWSILTLEGGGKYRVHDEHAEFVRECLQTNDVRDRVFPRRRKYMSSVRALLTFSNVWLVKIWEELARVGRESVPSRPYDTALAAMDPSSADRQVALQRAEDFYSFQESQIYIRECAAQAATLLQALPVVGEVCETFLAFEQLVETAKSNKEELTVLKELCDVVIQAIFKRCAERSGGVLDESFRKLGKYVEGAKEVAQQCRGRVKQFVLNRKISRDIAAVGKNVLDFSVVINIVISHDLHAKLDEIAARLEEDRLDSTENQLLPNRSE